MSDDAILPLATQYHPVEMVGVMVVNTAHEGYRRAGLVLRQGENTFPPVSLSVLTTLESDPRLVVTVIATDNDGDKQGGLDIQGTSTAIDDGLPPHPEPLQDVMAEPLPVIELLADVIAGPSLVVDPWADVIAEPSPVVEPLTDVIAEPLPAVEPLADVVAEPEQKGRGKK